jgi:hypothetical protein
MMLPASAGGNRVPAIAQLVVADEDTVRDLIHLRQPPGDGRGVYAVRVLDALDASSPTFEFTMDAICWSPPETSEVAGGTGTRAAMGQRGVAES